MILPDVPPEEPTGPGLPGLPGLPDPPGSPGAPFDDGQLAEALAARRHSALAALFDRYGASCYGLARRIVLDDQLAHDAVQEAFLTVWNDAARYDGSRGSLSSWLLMLTHHKAVDLVRREQRHRRHQTGLEELDAAPPPEPPTDEQAATAVRGARVRAALRELPVAQREVMFLAYFGGYTQAEIAQLTESPLGTVKTRMFAAVRRLRALLDAERQEVQGS